MVDLATERQKRLENWIFLQGVGVGWALWYEFCEATEVICEEKYLWKTKWTLAIL